MAYQYTITNGPSKFDLMLALFDGDASHRKTVTFTMDNPKQEPDQLGIPDHHFVINEIMRENGRGESWTFRGYYLNHGIKTTPIEGRFNTKTRHGWIKF